MDGVTPLHKQFPRNGQITGERWFAIALDLHEMFPERMGSGGPSGGLFPDNPLGHRHLNPAHRAS